MSERQEKLNKLIETATSQIKEAGHSSIDSTLVSNIASRFSMMLDNRDAMLVSGSDPSELETVRRNFVQKKLGVSDKEQGAILVKKVADQMSSIRLKNRVAFYYLTQKEFEQSTSNAVTVTSLPKSASTIQKLDILKEEAKEDDYLPTAAYEGQTVNDKENNVALFKHDNGQYYFAIYNDDGGVKIRSEGFETAKNRDQELSGAIRHHNDESMYTMLERGKYYMMVLRDEYGTEVGRSSLLKTEQEAKSNSVEDSSTKNRTVVKTITNTTYVIADEDDYMKGEAYKGHPVTDTENNIALFKAENDQLYFAVYNTDGSVRLRSEGFKTEEGRNSELKAVIKHMDNPAMYSMIKKGSYSIKVLKDGIGREVGRSCMFKHSV